MSVVTNGYCTKDELKAYIEIDHAVTDEAITVAINAASRAIDYHCQRRFYKDTTATARTFQTDRTDRALVDCFYSTGSLTIKTDSADNGTFDTTWSASEYELRPTNGVRAGLEGWPYFEIAQASTRQFPCSGRRHRVQVTALWGWNAVPPMVKEACLIWSSRLLKRADSPTGVLGGFADDVIRVSSRIDPDVEMLLAPYRKPVGG